jgi:hypothetical protein
LKAFEWPIEREEEYGRMFQMDHWDVRHSKQRLREKGGERGQKENWQVGGR